MELTQSQEQALSTLLERIDRGDPVIRLSGAAGTGKTTLIKRLHEELLDAVICTPTNKAAQVLRTKGLPANTFYRKFYILEEATADRRLRFTSCKRWLEENFNGSLPEGKISFAPILIIDEATMVNTISYREMMRMCDTLILVGDEHQLPPVGDRENPAGLFGSETPDATLTEVMRQAEGSQILDLAEAIRRGSPKVGKMLGFFEPEQEFRELVQQGAQSICFTNNERRRINAVARKALGHRAPWPGVGEKLIVTNNYSDDLLNGTLVEVLSFEWDRIKPWASVKLDFGDGTKSCRLNMKAFAEDQVASYRDVLEETMAGASHDEELGVEATFGYCLTAHKAQGSEWEKVVVFDQRSVVHRVQSNNPSPQMSPDEYVRRWLYTCVTRARKDLYIAPTHWAR